jgi:hypothetical protein
LPNAIALDTLIAIAGLKPRVLMPSLILNQRKDEIIKLLPSWNEDQTNVFAENFFLDESLVRRREATRKIFEDARAIKNIRSLNPENQLRGSFVLEGEKKNISIFFTLTPEKEARIQQLDIDLIQK